jgi:hypothetical protein
MTKRRFPIRNRTTARTRKLKEAIVASFSQQSEEAVRGLFGFREADWQSVLWWLDISGMAIYFLDRAQQVGADSIMPSKLKEELAERLQQNRFRIQALTEEARTVTQCFDSETIPYALLKGITLAPESVTDAALRSQADLDFLVSSDQSALAIRTIQRLGYRLHLISGITMEFTAGDIGLPDLSKIYSATAPRALDLHVLPEGSSKMALLTRRTTRVFDGARIATLAPADILMQQALHLLKHLCSDRSRLSWVLEFRRHTEARRFDRPFWSQVEILANEEMNGNLALSTAFWLAAEFFGEPPMELPRQWAAEAIPPLIRLWLGLYARNLFLADSIGNKLYLLLRGEIPCKVGPLKKTHLILFPRCLPARITHARAGEGFAERLRRYSVEAEFFFSRMQFHVVEGIRYGIEASRWRRASVRYGR